MDTDRFIKIYLKHTDGRDLLGYRKMFSFNEAEFASEVADMIK